MPWLQLSLKTTKEHSEEIEDSLLELGALSVTLMDAEDKPILEPAPGETPLWQDLQMLVLFDAKIDTKAILNHWQDHALSTFTSEEKFELIEDKDWEREWMDRFHPMKFGEKLWVCPSWKPIPDNSAINLLLDPGLAFGTGTHPTTALCLTWLDSIDLTGKSVIDYGCGSGILTIAALKLGANKVYAVDIDPQAIIATEENAKRNQVFDERLIIGQPEILQAEVSQKIQTDILVANILAGPLEELAESISSHCLSHAKIALSGLLDSQANSLRETYQHWFQMDKPIFQEEWGLLTGIKKS